MFWEQFADAVEEDKGVACVLRRPHFTLDEVLAEDDVLQEGAANSALVAFLARPDTVAALVRVFGAPSLHARASRRKQVELVAVAGPADAGPERVLRLPWVACELLRFAHPAVVEALFAHEAALLHALVRGLQGPPEALHPLVAEYMGRVLLRLLEEGRTKDTLAFVRSSGLLQRLVTHLHSASVLNVLFGVLQACTVEVEVAAATQASNARLERFLDADSVAWLSETGLSRMLALQVRVRYWWQNELTPEKGAQGLCVGGQRAGSAAARVAPGALAHGCAAAAAVQRPRLPGPLAALRACGRCVLCAAGRAHDPGRQQQQPAGQCARPAASGGGAVLPGCGGGAGLCVATMTRDTAA